jgi:hypothetical protein
VVPDHDQACVLSIGEVENRLPYRISASLVTSVDSDAQSPRDLHALSDDFSRARAHGELEIRAQTSIRIAGAERVGKLLGGRAPDVQQRCVAVSDRGGHRAARFELSEPS